MAQSATDQVWKSYLEAYKDVSSEERVRLLKESVSDDVLSTNPGDETHGLEALVTHIEQFQKHRPGAYFKINWLKSHHEQGLSEWTLYNADGTVVTTGYSYGVSNSEGRLKKVIGFF